LPPPSTPSPPPSGKKTAWDREAPEANMPMRPGPRVHETATTPSPQDWLRTYL
jgi:hypothetical protein